MKIVIYGSTKLTEVCCRFLEDTTDCIILGYISNQSPPTVPGNMTSWNMLSNPPPDEEYDFALCIQYDRIILNTAKVFNLHTGLLPEYGGTDILYHTLKNGASEQGLTFHKMERKLDEGSIISKGSYPVVPNDTVLDLYERMLCVGPPFLKTCVELLKVLSTEKMKAIASHPPKKYRRGKDIAEADLEEYQNIPRMLRERFG